MIERRKDWLTRCFISALKRSNQSILSVSKTIGVTNGTIGTWGVSASPRLVQFERAVNAIGYELVIVKDQR